MFCCQAIYDWFVKYKVFNCFYCTHFAMASIILIGLYYRWKHFNSWLDIFGKSILITGCDSGIGYQLALHLDKLGFHVFAACFNQKSDGACKLKKLSSNRISVVELDITDDTSVEQAHKTIQEELNKNGEGLWAVINNAGVCVLGMFEWTTMSQVQLMYNVNVLGTIRVLKSFIPLVRKTKGRVIIISSIAAKMAIPGGAVYSSTKTALEGMADSLRMELAADGINVCLIEPGNHTKHTKLMQNQTNYRNEQWEAMTEEARERDKNLFVLYHDCLLRSKNQSIPSLRENFCLIFKHIEHSILNSCPNARYLSAKGVEGFVVRLTSMLPTRWSDKIVIIMVKKSWKLHI